MGYTASVGKVQPILAPVLIGKSPKILIGKVGNAQPGDLGRHCGVSTSSTHDGQFAPREYSPDTGFMSSSSVSLVLADAPLGCAPVAAAEVELDAEAALDGVTGVVVEVELNAEAALDGVTGGKAELAEDEADALAVPFSPFLETRLLRSALTMNRPLERC
jgi:hypothetical protein